MKERSYECWPACQFMNLVEFLCMQAHHLANAIFLPIACYKFFLIWKLNREGMLSLCRKTAVCLFVYLPLSICTSILCQEKENTTQSRNNLASCIACYNLSLYIFWFCFDCKLCLLMSYGYTLAASS